MSQITRDHFVAFARDVGQCIIATVSDGGDPEAALVGTAVTDDGQVLINTFSDSRKLANLAGHPHVALVIGWADKVSFQVEGSAEVLSGEDRATYRAIFLEQHPGARVFHEGFSLVRVTPEWLRSYDASAGAPVVIEHECWPA